TGLDGHGPLGLCDPANIYGSNATADVESWGAVRRTNPAVFCYRSDQCHRSMKIVTFKEQKMLRKTNDTFFEDLLFNPGERYIVDDFCQNQIYTGIPDSIHECSDLTPLLQKRMPESWVNKKVLFYRGVGLGDELMLTGVVRYFREVLHAMPYVVCPAMHRPIWTHEFEHSDSLCSHPISIPMHLDPVWRAAGKPFFDYAFFLESVSEWD